MQNLTTLLSPLALVFVLQVREWRSKGGRFLERKDKTPQAAGLDGFDPTKEIWYDVGDKRAREKASMSLRERTPDAIEYVNKLKEAKQREFEESCTGSRLPLRTLKAATSHPPASDHRYDAPPIDYSRTLPAPPHAHPLSYYAHFPPPPTAWTDYSQGRDSLGSDSPEAFDPSFDYRSHRMTPLEAKQAEEIQQMKLALADHAKVIQKLKHEIAEYRRKVAVNKNEKPRVTPNPYIPNSLLSPVPFNSTGEDNDEANLHFQTLFMFSGDTTEGSTQERSVKKQVSSNGSKTGGPTSPAMGLLPPIKQEDDELWPQVESPADGKAQSSGLKSPILNDVPTLKRSRPESMTLVLSGHEKEKALMPTRHSFSPMASRKKSLLSESTNGRGVKRNNSCPTLASNKVPSQHGSSKAMKRIKTEEV